MSLIIIIKEAFILWNHSHDELILIEKFLHEDKINDQFYRRLFLRSVFTIIETQLQVLKKIIKIDHTINIPDSNLEEMTILNGKKVFLDNKGNAKSKDEFHSFEPSFRFTLNLFSKTFNSPLIDYGNSSYESLIKLLKRRNDLTHPKSSKNLIISDSEIIESVAMTKWFMGIMSQYNIIIIKWLRENQVKFK